MQNLKELSVLILTYNRIEKFNICLESLYKHGIKRVYISIDGPKNKKDITNQKKIISLCKKNIFDLDIKINYLKYNHGCRLGPIKGITWFFSQNKYGVILEDDVIITKKCIESFSFLLEKNKNNKEFMSISSFNEFYNNNFESIYSFPVWRSWGWASWADRWHNHLDFTNKIKKYNIWELYQLLPNDLKSIETAKLVKASQLNLLDAWDYEFNFTHIVNKKSSLTLGGINTLVYGFDSEATHTIDLDSIGINFELFCEREFDLKIVKKSDSLFNKMILKKCGFIYNENNFLHDNIYNYLKFLYYSFIFRLRIIKRFMYKTANYIFFLIK